MTRTGRLTPSTVVVRDALPSAALEAGYETIARDVPTLRDDLPALDPIAVKG